MTCFDLGQGEMKRLGLTNEAVEEPSALQGMQRSPVPPEAPAAPSLVRRYTLSLFLGEGTLRLEPRPRRGHCGGEKQREQCLSPVTGAGWSGNTVLPQLPKDSTRPHCASHWKHLKIYVRSHVFVLAPVLH